MSTTVRIRDEDKARLDALQAKLTLAGGRRLPLEEVLARALEVAEAHERELLGGDAGPSVDPRELARVLALPADLGVQTDEATIDAALYGHERATPSGGRP